MCNINMYNIQIYMYIHTKRLFKLKSVLTQKWQVMTDYFSLRPCGLMPSQNIKEKIIPGNQMTSNGSFIAWNLINMNRNGS